jgi:hypothetical protein
MKYDAPKGFNFLSTILTSTGGNSGFAQRGVLCFKKSSSCLEVHVTFDTLEP